MNDRAESPEIVILSGGAGPEREVSLASGRCLADSLSLQFSVRLIDLVENRLPADLSAVNQVVFPIIHGEFGEDGELQALLCEAGLEFAGSQEEASRLCMRKDEAKQVVSGAGVRVCPGISFNDPRDCKVDEVIDRLGADLVIKPVDQGSSVSLFITSGVSELQRALLKLPTGKWLIEKRIFGREITVGLLGDHPLGIVEVIPVGGVYDFHSKYSPGSTEYRYPAVLESEIEYEVKSRALLAFEACGCRDFARVDFILCEDGNVHFLEINTLPGLTSTSLLPKSALVAGYDFNLLCRKLVSPAIARFLEKGTRHTNCHAA